MKPGFGFDTSALVSLGHTDLIELILEKLEVIVCSTVVDELVDIARREDNDAQSARKWLGNKTLLNIHSVDEGIREESAEADLFLICKMEDIPMVIDDIRAMKKFDPGISCYFSVHMIYFLVIKGVITLQRGIISIEKMRKSRDWKNNLIYTIGRSLFE